MTQRLSTKIGAQGGLETNIQSDQSQGYQVADNVIYRPVGGLSKRRGSKKLVETVDGETKRIIMPTQANDGVISIQEDDATGEAKVLGYKKEGVSVDLYSLEGSRKVLLNPSVSFTPYDKVRLEFSESIYESDLSFIENAFERKTGVFEGFWKAEESFTTIAVEQDSVDPDLLRVSKFVNLPTKNDEITLTSTNSLSVAPTLLSNYDIISVGTDYFTIYPTPLAPAWTSTGDTGTIDFTFQTFRVIEVDDSALTTDSLLTQNVKCFYETQGTAPLFFSCDDLKTCLEDRSGDEIVFNSNLGQMYVSDESTEAPIISYYGVEQPIDCLPYYITNYATALNENGTIKEQTRYAYAAVLEKVINGQSFLSSPSSFFYIETEDESANYTTISGANIGLTASGDVFFILGSQTVKTIQVKNVTSTPTIPDLTQLVLTQNTAGSPNTYYWSVDDQILVLGAPVTSISQSDVFINRLMVCDVGLPEAFHTDLVNLSLSSSNNTDYYVNLYRTVGVDTSSTPDISQFFLVKRQIFRFLTSYEAPTIATLDNEITDLNLENQLPLYTNPTEEGVLKSNNVAPQHQNFTEKNGVFYLGDLKKPEIVSNTLFPDPTIATVASNEFNITYNFASFIAAFTPVGAVRFYNLSGFAVGLTGLIFTSSKRVYIDNTGTVYNALDDSVISSSLIIF